MFNRNPAPGFGRQIANFALDRLFEARKYAELVQALHSVGTIQTGALLALADAKSLTDAQGLARTAAVARRGIAGPLAEADRLVGLSDHRLDLIQVLGSVGMIQTDALRAIADAKSLTEAQGLARTALAAGRRVAGSLAAKEGLI